MSRVGEIMIRLQLAASERERAEETRRHIETVVMRRAVDELERLVHDRFGAQAIVRVRRLAFRWRITRDELSEAATALAMAEDLAGGILADLERADGPARLRPDPEANVVVFADEAHERAVLLADAFQARDAWFHRDREPAATWSALQDDTAALAAVTTWLEKMDLARRVLPWLAEQRRDPHRTSALDPEQRAESQFASPAPWQPASVDAARQEEQRVSTTTPPPAIDDGSVGVQHSEAAGIWYLARRVLELDMAEALWCVGAKEGAFLSHVAAAVLGGGLADPAWRWFGGAFADPPILEALPPWGIEEVRDKLGRSFEPVVLERLARELEPPTDGGDQPTRALVAWCAAVLCASFCGRLGLPPTVALVRRHVIIPGRFVLASEVLRVELAMELLDIDLRRAGLDFNPGHLAWLDRKVEIVFGEG